jgi:hypothetical protein
MLAAEGAIGLIDHALTAAGLDVLTSTVEKWHQRHVA